MSTITESRDTQRPFAPTGLFASVTMYFATYRKSRRILAQLNTMEDHILDDIGLTRADVNKASVADMGTDRMAMLSVARARHID